MNQKLWTRNFSLVTLASALGSAGAIAGGFALSFLVFDETGSTLASALVIAIQLVPHIFVPFIAAPIMDRLPRKRFLVCGDIANGLVYAAMGLWLLHFEFSYIAYLCISLGLACLQSVDSLAYKSIYPELIPKGTEQKGYSVASMLYPVLNIIMAPMAALLLDVVGVPLLLISQGALSVTAAVTESFIRLDESERRMEGRYTFSMWRSDINQALQYLKKEKGMLSIYEYMAVTNGVATGYSPILVAFFRTTPGFNAAMYSLFSVVEFLGRTLGSAMQYRVNIPPKKRHGFVLFVYQVYELMDMCLLWIPYPLMLVNRAVCGFLGSNSAIVREAAVQRYIPPELRARVNAFYEMLVMAMGSALSLLVGMLGELMDYRLCVSICGAVSMVASWYFIWGRRRVVRKVYEAE